MNLCVVSVLIIVCAAAAQEDLASSNIPQSCHTSNDDGSSACTGSDSESSLYVEQGQGSQLNVTDTSETTSQPAQTVSDTSETTSQSAPTVSGQFPGRKGLTSQRATELFVNTWTDVRTWTKRNDTSSVCQQDIERTILGYNENEMWALTMFDSSAKPGPSLLEGRSAFSGNYYQCRGTRAPNTSKREGFKGTYCVVSMANLTNAFDKSFFELLAFARIQLGICLPDSCSQGEITEIVQERIQTLHLTSIFQGLSTDCRTDDREYTQFTYAAILIVLIIGTLTILGTIIDLAIVQCPHSKKSAPSLQNKTASPDVSTPAENNKTASPDVSTPTENNKTASPDVSTPAENNKTASSEKSVQAEKVKTESHSKKPDLGVWVKVLLSFSAYTNGRRLLSTSQPPGSITVIPGIRFLTMSWIVVGHVYFFFVYGNAINISQGMHDTVKYRFFDLIQMLTLGVDAFFTISGMLVSYLTIKHVIDKGLGFNWRYFYLHRYWRLTPTYMVAVVLVLGLQRFAVSGTMAQTVQPTDKVICEKTFWQLPLYLNNLLVGEDIENCFVQSWSLAADYQFYLLSPLMMIPFYYHKVAGYLSILFFVTGQWIISGVLNYRAGGEISMLGFSVEWFKYCYIPFYSRIAPFAIGIFAGYIMSVNKGRITMKPSTVIIGWIVATVAIAGVIFGFHDDLTREATSSALVAAIYNSVSRSIWGASVCWIIIACNSGYGGPLNTFLSWPPFTVLGRLTYTGYLIQISLINIVFYNLEQAAYLNVSNVFVFGTVDLVFTCLVSAVLVVCVEFPTFNLEKVIRERK